MPFDAETFTVDPLLLTTPRARLEYLARFLRALPPERFDYASTSKPNGQHDCGTAACIAGWALAVFERPYEPFCQTGAELFGLDHDASGALFFSAGGREHHTVSPRDAADVLDHLLATGEVDWSVARAGSV